MGLLDSLGGVLAGLKQCRARQRSGHSVLRSSVRLARFQASIQPAFLVQLPPFEQLP
jgi:hypothetical protein